MAAVTVRSDFGAQESKVCHCFHLFSIYLPWSDGTRCRDLSVWMLSFKLAFSRSSSTFIEDTLVPLPSLSAIRVMSSAYLRLLIFLPAILIRTYDSSSTFCKMYSEYKLNKQGDNIQPWCTPFPILNCCSMLGFNCCFLTCIQISQEAAKLVWYSHLLKKFP